MSLDPNPMDGLPLAAESDDFAFLKDKEGPFESAGDDGVKASGE